jgi:hypothetical protein
MLIVVVAKQVTMAKILRVRFDFNIIMYFWVLVRYTSTTADWIHLFAELAANDDLSAR